ncbi:MAG: 6-phosphofructokinase [Candidatus Latescibacterota bacterium]|nr:MAG: 6-phosphofructokinase [Candidatus Latescibacterota bacterium]
MTTAPPKKIGILTSGGDSPGMNACIRAITRTAVYHELEVVGFRSGFKGVLEMDFRPLGSRSVSNIIQRGGTILGSSRCEEFEEKEGLYRAAENLREIGIDALFVIGGNGSLRGARELMDSWSGQVIGLPGTIDNDLGGTDWTIGFFTALDTALDSIDKIRDTAEAFERIFLIEVMGRLAGDIALGVGISGGAEEILIPEIPLDLEAVGRRLMGAKKRGKGSYIIVVAEGVCNGGAHEVAREITRITSYECKLCVLGHTQRGGSPTARDRILATRLGAHAVKVALDGATGVMVGVQKGELALTRFENLERDRRILDPEQLLKINTMLTI